MRPQTYPPTTRLPGRSFTDPEKPLGWELIEHSQELDDEEGTGVDVGHVAERAKAIGVMRKAEELMATENPPPENFRRAMQLAAGRLGLKLHEYDELVRNDPELQELEAKVLEAAQAIVRSRAQ